MMAGLPLLATKAVVLAAILATMAVDDVRHLRIRNGANVLLALSGLMFAAIDPAVDFASALVGGLAGGLAGWLVQAIYLRMRGIVALGTGDVKFLAAAGIWVGALGLSPLVLIASLSGIAFALIRLAYGIGLRARIPFAPFLGLGLLVVVILQDLGQAPWQL